MLNMQNLISINITIGDRNFKVKIDAKDEPVVINACKRINEKVAELKATYGGKDMQDFLSMALLSLLTADQAPTIEKEEVQNALNQLEELLS